jgi:predicted nucleic acid-binding protein
MRFEIRKHWNKLKKISKLTDLELETAYDKMLTKFTFINEELIPQNDWEKAETFVADIDLDDIDFVALTKYLKGNLWTGDKQDKNYIRFVAAHNKNLERSSY